MFDYKKNIEKNYLA